LFSGNVFDGFDGHRHGKELTNLGFANVEGHEFSAERIARGRGDGDLGVEVRSEWAGIKASATSKESREIRLVGEAKVPDSLRRPSLQN
jgi:hypothetical protein